ncbi:putative ADP-ribose pyrophosphatase YjhB [Sporosarcina sp. NCCP-2222]|uniref:NUDIX hydrolase n=1 Tax=Sporosarcina sp. NCCP-2222 TaxID=2935073 RepID=UPI0020878010|nr:NUDIX hydrolase [Sporosarcina sp. NCCP-2222]GKV55789.1 putative ADP-ribose pyrophosphatase YjhB [Sporosarcina sp. NCCP-2222]
MSHLWLEWTKRIQAIAQSGLAFSKDMYDIERYEELRDISVEIMAAYADLEIEKVRELFANDEGYQTPKSDVRGVVFKDGRILMVKENADDRWALPGGFCDIGLSPSENIVKEIKEESGYDVVPVRLLALFDKNKHPHPPEAYHYYKIFILCELIGGEACASGETSSIGFFGEDQLPRVSANRNTECQIKKMFEFLRDPLKGTILD